MEVKVITEKELERVKKKAQRREWFQQKSKEFKWWVYNNKETILVLAPVVVGATVKGVSALNRHIALQKEQDLKDLYVYDRSLGHYFRLRRKLTNSEWVEIDRRRVDGERLADILDELKVLK